MVYIFVALVMYAAAIMFGAAAARHMNITLSVLVTNLIAVFLPLALILPRLTKSDFSNHKFGVWMAVACGLAVSVYAIAVNRSYAANKVGIVAPIVLGGGIVLSTILSWLIFKEKLTVAELGGISVMIIGISILVYARATQ